MANSRTSTLAQIQNLNQNLKDQYLNIVWPGWLISLNAGRVNASTAPKPPNGYELTTEVDATDTTGQTIWCFPQIGTTPVCEMPPIPGEAQHATGVALIGSAILDAPGWFSIQIGDKTPVGMVVAGTSQDGQSGLFKRHGAAMGGGWFQKVG